MNKLQISVVALIVALALGVEVIPRLATATLTPQNGRYVTLHMSCSGPGGCKVAPEDEIQIPESKHFVIQYASATATVEGLIPQQVMIRLTVPYFQGSSSCSFYEYGLPATWDGVISGRNQFSSAQQMNVIATPPEQSCAQVKGVGAYISSTDPSQIATLNVHLSGYVE